MNDQESGTPRSQEDLNKFINLSETVGGFPTRKYLNEKVTPTLLEGMRMIAVRKPEDPLRALGQFLIDRSKERAKADGDASK
ncbi:hypothetical protein ZYGR_0AI02770 [Zygosaccharomyces rouxii]|uniref:COMPASS component SDC1 n=1 Tax=Zygosaccharomyces rouxii TaxID=4956 RepID=A0A1Q3ABK6_ZYGRO|nr:hypothetical protein ZYGR_0AI02770 [Zygosaccharomyces rouxii]